MLNTAAGLHSLLKPSHRRLLDCSFAWGAVCLPLVALLIAPLVFLEGATSRVRVTGTWQYDMANSLERFARSGLLGCQDAQPH